MTLSPKKIRYFTMLGAELFFSLIGLALVTTVLHEGIHYVAAMIMKVPIISFTWFDPNYLAPALVSGLKEYTLGAGIVSYAGGLVAGALFLVPLVLKRNWFSQSLYRWLLGFFVAMFGAWQICQGVLEGAFHDLYIAGAASGLSLPNIVGFAVGLVGIALYCIFMPGLKSLLGRDFALGLNRAKR